MLRTSLCDLLGIDVPIILAGMGAGATSAEFAAAISNQGGLGSVGSLFARLTHFLPIVSFRTYPGRAIGDIRDALPKPLPPASGCK